MCLDNNSFTKPALCKEPFSCNFFKMFSELGTCADLGISRGGGGGGGIFKKTLKILSTFFIFSSTKLIF